MKAIAPGKIILSGEHAVVYGQPAIVQAVSLYSTSQMVANNQKGFTFALPDLNHLATLSITEVLHIKEELHERFQRFRMNKLAIDKVITNPVQPFAYILANHIEKREIQKTHYTALTTCSEIPVGCGLGSSAATVASSTMALCAYYRLKISTTELYNLTFEIERFHHGSPSGVDPYITIHGGTVKFHNQRTKSLPSPPLPLFLVNTGKPRSGTGQCVARVEKRFGKSTIWSEFADVTGSMVKAIETKNEKAFCTSIQNNHRLLSKIGVVPPVVEYFISDIEALGGTAKITGAGSIKGEAGGIVLICIDDPPCDLIKTYDFELLTAHEDSRGVRTI